MNQSDNTKDLIIAFLSGALAGGAIAYLLQTDKGKEIIEEASASCKEKIAESKTVIEESEAALKQKLKEALLAFETKQISKEEATSK